MTDQYDLKLVAVETGQTEKDLSEMAIKLTAFVNDEGFYLTISGYDDDSRELWEIPEAIELCKRIISSGLIVVLKGSSQVKELGARDFGGLPAPLGAFEVWAFSEGRMKHGGAGFSKTDLSDTLKNLIIERN